MVGSVQGPMGGEQGLMGGEQRPAGDSDVPRKEVVLGGSVSTNKETKI